MEMKEIQGSGERSTQGLLGAQDEVSTGMRSGRGGGEEGLTLDSDGWRECMKVDDLIMPVSFASRNRSAA